MIEEFPSRLEKINNGQGIPLQFELLPINAAIQKAGPPLQHQISNVKIERLERCFDDLLSAQTLVNKYENDDDDDKDVLDFSEQITKVMNQFRDAINLMNSKDGDKAIDDCLTAYDHALDGRMIDGKFCKKWKKILNEKVPK